MSTKASEESTNNISQEENVCNPKIEQEARAKLRTRFLRSIQSIYNCPAEFHLHERTRVSATFRGTDIELENIAVSDLQTPIGPLGEAMIRASDVISFTVNVEDVM